MPSYKYAVYPSAKIVDSKGKEINHLLWGDWVEMRSDEQPRGKMLPVFARGTSGWMHEDDLQDEQILEVVFVDVGQGDGCLVVTPDNRHLIVDAGISDNMYRHLKWRYNGFRTRWKFDAAIITHPDKDHYYGFRKLFEEPNVTFGTLYHNGIIETRVRKEPLGRMRRVDGVRYVAELMEDRDTLAHFLNSRRWRHPTRKQFDKQYPALLKSALDSGRVDDIRMLSTHHSDEGFVPGFGKRRTLRLRVLGPVADVDASGRARLRVFGDKPGSRAFNISKTKNGHSVILQLEYRNLRLLFGGDLNSPAEVHLLQHYSGVDDPWPWQPEVEQAVIEGAAPVLGADITKLCHHGSSDFTDTFMKAVAATATVISSGDNEPYAHPRSDTLGAIGLHGHGWRPLIFSTELARSSREEEGITREEIGRMHERIHAETDPGRRADLEVRQAALFDRLLERNVVVYGSIYLRSDGNRVVMGYKLERERRSGGRLTRWDIYTLTRRGNAPLAFEGGA